MKNLTTRQIFSQMLIKLRKDKGISRKQLAEDIGVSVASIGYYEKDDRVPDIETLVKIANYFDVSCDELLKGLKSPNKNIYQDIWLSDKTINNLRNLKTVKPINQKTQCSYLFDFLDNILSDGRFVDFLMFYYRYAIGFNGAVELNDMYTNASIEAQKYIDLFLGEDMQPNFPAYNEYNLFAAVKMLDHMAHHFQYKDLIEYEDYFEEKLNSIEEASGNGNDNPQDK